MERENKLNKRVAKYPDFVRLLLKNGFRIDDIEPKYGYPNECVFIFYLTREQELIFDGLYAENQRKIKAKSLSK